MTFFARPNLDNDQFKQLSGTTLTLSGVTDFAGTLKSKGVEIDATATSVGQVLTYIGGKIQLQPSSGGGSGLYSGATPSTCSVGGLVAGSTLTGKTLSCILQDILVPLKYPTISAPGLTFTITPSTLYYEVGSCVAVTGCITYSMGCVSPQYCGASQYRSGLPNTHKYENFDATFICCSCTTLSTSTTLTQCSVNPGCNTVCANVCYDAECTPAYDSAGGTSFCAPNPLPAGQTSAVSQTICGLYPYYYGKVASGGCPAGVNRPTASCALIVGGTKAIATSTGTLCLAFCSSADDYIWFATPDASTTKTCWYVDTLNNGGIGGAVSPGGNLFPANTTVCPVATACWGGQCYKIYISNYQTSTICCGTCCYIMELRNS